MLVSRITKKHSFGPIGMPCRVRYCEVMMRRIKVAMAAVSAALLLTAGCTSSMPGITDYSPSAVTTSINTPSAQGSLVDGYTMMTAAANKIHVPLPSDLQVLDPSQIDVSPESEQAFSDMAEKLGMTADDLMQQLSTLDLFAIDADSNNINILQPLPAVGTQLSDVEPTLESIGATGIGSLDTTCPAGPVLMVTYTLTDDDMTMSQAQLYVQSDTMTTTVITITGVTWTADQVSQIATNMLAGLEHI